MRRLRQALAVLLALTTAGLAFGQSVQRTPLAPGHPLVGFWRLDIPQLRCHENYHVRADGTTNVTSGQEVSESEFEISAAPDAKGFYKWVDKVTRDNGKPDCAGTITEPGQTSTNYLLMHPEGAMFLMCTEEDLKTCIGPFVRDEGV